MPSLLHRFRVPVLAVSLVAMLIAPTGAVAAPGAPRVTGFTLIDADTDLPIAGFDPIPQDAVLNLATLPTRRVNMRANTDAPAGSVRLKKDGGRPLIDNAGPYALLPESNGDFSAWTPVPGRHTAFATAFTSANGRGAPGDTMVLKFRVVDVRGPNGPSDPVFTPPNGPLPVPLPPNPGVPAPRDDEPSGNPPASDSGSRCGPIPATPAGWQREVSSTFSEETRLGDWPGPVAARDWRSRTAGYRDSSGRGVYNSDKTVSEHDGLLDVWIHSEGGTRYVAAPMPRIGSTFGQRITLCMRADHIPGYKLAFLLWPSRGPGNSHGEIDFPEGKLTPGGTGGAFMHYDPKPASGRHQDAYSTGTSTADWHRYTLEWDPGSPGSQADDQVSFYFDGDLIGRSAGARVPDGPMHYVMQIETYLKGQALPAPAEGHVLIDWVTIEVPD